MTRTELLQLLIHQARESGFEFRKWFRTHTARPWTTPADAVDWLAQGSRAHMLLFSHSFARHFFREGERIRFIQPALAYERVTSDGKVRSVHRRAHTRQSSREDVWKFHLREMAAAEEPLRYIRRYLLLEETMQEAATEEPQPLPAEPLPAPSAESLPAQPAESLPAESTESLPAEAGSPTAAPSHPTPSLPAEEPGYDDELLVRD